METAQGIVFRVFEKEFNGKMLYTLKFDGDDNYYRLGEKRYAGTIESGYEVKVAFETKGANNLVRKVKLIAKGEPVEPKSPGGGKSRPGGGSKGSGGTDWAAKDQNIQYQSARNAAIEMVKMLLEQNGLEFPKGVTKTNVKGRGEIIDGMVDVYTAKFFEDCTGNACLLYTSPSPRDRTRSRMPSSA